jgi:hypothetical protein
MSTEALMEEAGLVLVGHSSLKATLDLDCGSSHAPSAPRSQAERGTAQSGHTAAQDGREKGQQRKLPCCGSGFSQGCSNFDW